MSSIDPFRITAVDVHRDPKAGRVRTYQLADDDCQRLERHLTQPNATNRTYLDHVLRHKVRASQPLKGTVPKDLITGTSCVRYSINGGPPQIGLMSHWSRNGSISGVIPVCSLLGATLIGMRIGERAPLLHEDGAIGSLAVLDIAPFT
jgi:hypothetical protein